ncbi:rust resistance kinase Lr10-like [Hevea brasiliensis]|nr:rust resistance kinase Lr10-like [Hevea brasiliensis]
MEGRDWKRTKYGKKLKVSATVKMKATAGGMGYVGSDVGREKKVMGLRVVGLGIGALGFLIGWVLDLIFGCGLLGFTAGPFRGFRTFISSADTKNHFLGWKRLQDIALGIAKGIEYLHQGCDQRILHFDIKPHNILLDHDFNPKISDFGLAKFCAKDQSAVSMTTARGTIGYIAPEVFSRNIGNVSYKSDVYSFGMLVLEMVGGRKIVDVAEGNDKQIYFPEWIYNLLEEGEDLRFEIEEEGDTKIAKKLAIVGLWCIQWNPADRPSMKVAVHMLEGEGENLPTPPNPFSSSVPTKTKARIPGRRLLQELEVISEAE